MESHSAGRSFSLDSLEEKKRTSSVMITDTVKRDGFAGEILTVEHVPWRR